MRRRETLIERQPATRSICTSMAGKWAEVALKLIPCRMLAVWANHYSAYQQNVTEEVDDGLVMGLAVCSSEYFCLLASGAPQ